MNELTAASALRVSRRRRLGRSLQGLEDALRLAERGVYPVFDLVVRLWLAKIFLASGLLKLLDWHTAVTLATHEYPVAWLAPETAAALGIAVEVLGGLCLALGLATRLAAAALLALALVIQFEYRALAEHWHWALLFGGYLVMGAGPLSLDRMLAPGLADSALPLAQPLSRLYAALTRWIGSVCLLAMRVWLAALLPDAALPLAAALVLGFATRPAALAVLVPALALPLPDLPYPLFLAGWLALRGGGGLALDAPLWRWLRRLGFAEVGSERLARVVVVGAGFGGVRAARGLRHSACEVTLIDRRNYHLFQPLLYQVATASLSPADIATPTRALFRDQSNVRVLLGTVGGVDAERREVLLDERRIPYDFLVLATGARHSYFGRDDWEPWAPGLKQIDDATAIRRRLLLAFERAEDCHDPAERARLLSFVIVGGGPTGVELAGAIAELARHGLQGEFRHIDPSAARVLLIEAGPRLLAAFPPALSANARAALEALGVEVLTGGRVEQVDAEGVVVSGQRVGSRTVFWAAGVAASPAAQWLGREADRAGRLKVGPALSVPGLPEVFAIGDTACSEAWGGKPVPGLAPAAQQGGDYVARVIRARLEGRAAPPPFRYHHLGSLATIGRKAAVADFGWLRLHGAPAWWLWGAVHVLFLAGMRNRVSVAIEWFWAYLTLRRGTRLITGERDG